MNQQKPTTEQKEILQKNEQIATKRIPRWKRTRVNTRPASAYSFVRF